MLVLTRGCGEAVRIGADVTVTVIKASHGEARLAFDAPPDVAILRTELEATAARSPRPASRRELAARVGELEAALRAVRDIVASEWMLLDREKAGLVAAIDAALRQTNE